MVSERLKSIALAGIDLQLQQIKNTYFRIVIRENVEFEGEDCVKLSEIFDGKTYLICVAPPKFASRCLIGWMEEIELEKER